MSNKRILIFSLAYHPMIGGAEIAIKEITDRISDIEFDLVTPRFSKSYPKTEKIGNINVYRIGFSADPESALGYLSKILFVPLAAMWALKMAKVRPYDAYWLMMTYMLFPVVLMRLMGDRMPYILTLQDGDPFEHVFARMRILPFLPMLMYGMRHAFKIQTISNFLAQWARTMGYKGELHVIPNGVDIKQFQPINYDKVLGECPTLITTSRLVEKNGIADIIESLQFLPDNIKLQVIGTGPLEASLKDLTSRSNLEHRVQFLGFVDPQEIPKYLHNAGIFIRPSLSEGQGISFIEAMAAGLPVIATSVGGIPDFLRDGETGLICNVHDPRSISEKVLEYMNNPDLTSRIVKNAKEMVFTKYDWYLIAKEMKGRVFDTL